MLAGTFRAKSPECVKYPLVPSTGCNMNRCLRRANVSASDRAVLTAHREKNISSQIMTNHFAAATGTEAIKVLITVKVEGEASKRATEGGGGGGGHNV